MAIVELPEPHSSTRRGRASTINQWKLAKQRPDLRQGVLLALRLEDCVVKPGRLDADQGEKGSPEQRGAQRAIHQDRQHESSDGNSHYDATRPSPGTRSTQFW
jgi:hypothetical protein